jgi:hypothetical protein
VLTGPHSGGGKPCSCEEACLAGAGVALGSPCRTTARDASAPGGRASDEAKDRIPFPGSSKAPHERVRRAFAQCPAPALRQTRRHKPASAPCALRPLSGSARVRGAERDSHGKGSAHATVLRRPTAAVRHAMRQGIKKALGTRARRRGRYVHGRRLAPRGRTSLEQSTCPELMVAPSRPSPATLCCRAFGGQAYGLPTAASQRFATAASPCCLQRILR